MKFIVVIIFKYCKIIIIIVKKIEISELSQK